MAEFEHLERRPDIWDGAWIVRGTAVPVFLLRDYFAAHGFGQTLVDYPGVSADALEEALFADSLTFEPDRERTEEAWRMMHAQWETQRLQYRQALERIRGADLKRCSAGWLQRIAEEALG